MCTKLQYCTRYMCTILHYCTCCMCDILQYCTRYMCVKCCTSYILYLLHVYLENTPESIQYIKIANQLMLVIDMPGILLFSRVRNVYAPRRHNFPKFCNSELGISGTYDNLAAFQHFDIFRIFSLLTILRDFFFNQLFQTSMTFHLTWETADSVFKF